MASTQEKSTMTVLKNSNKSSALFSKQRRGGPGRELPASARKTQTHAPLYGCHKRSHVLLLYRPPVPAEWLPFSPQTFICLFFCAHQRRQPFYWCLCSQRPDNAAHYSQESRGLRPHMHGCAPVCVCMCGGDGAAVIDVRGRVELSLCIESVCDYVWCPSWPVFLLSRIYVWYSTSCIFS